MNKEFLIESARDNWYLLVGLAVLPIAAIMYSGTKGSSEEDAEGSAFTQRAEAATLTPASARGSVLTSGPFKSAPTRGEEARDSIRSYETFNRNNPSHNDVPLNMKRMGNLYYSALQEYEKAIQQYEMLMVRYPDFDAIEEIYPALAACYERTGKVSLEYDTYRRMIKAFPPESEYHKFAQQMLNGQG